MSDKYFLPHDLAYRALRSNISVFIEADSIKRPMIGQGMCKAPLSRWLNLLQHAMYEWPGIETKKRGL